MRPQILFEADRLHIIVADAERHLIASGEPIYQRDGKIIRIGRFPTKGCKPDLKFVEVSKEWLIGKLTEIISWSKMEGRKQVAIGCPFSVAATYLAQSGQWRLPVLTAVVTAPTLRQDGSLLCQPGYDDATGLYFDPQGVDFPTIPENPTKEDARACLDWMIQIVREVPFVHDEQYGQVNRSVFLSAVLSALMRTAIPTVPLHGFSAPKAGSGKSIWRPPRTGFSGRDEGRVSGCSGEPGSTTGYRSGLQAQGAV
jgi:putative DNA primase/helicase